MDNVFLTGPLGSVINIGSWLVKDGGAINYGGNNLLRQSFAQSPYAEGARLGFETAAGPRTMTFPLRIAAGLGYQFEQVEGVLREMVRPGGYVDLQPANGPTNMIRFDIIGGDVAQGAFSPDLQRIGRRNLTLTLQTQPIGYMPTWITIASVASVSMLGDGFIVASLPPTYFAGDMPGLMELTILPTTATQYDGTPAAWVTDGFAWANGGRPSFLAGLGGGSWVASTYPASYRSADGGNFRRGMSGTYGVISVPSSQTTGWFTAFSYLIPSALEPAYRGRFRAFAQVYSEATRPFQMLIDTVPGANTLPALATAGVIATTAPSVASAYPIFDMGEISLPPIASGIQQSQTLRLSVAPVGSYAATVGLRLMGVYLQPLNGEAGVVSRGLAYPSVGNATANTTLTGALLRQDVGALGWVASAPTSDLRRYYRGVMPQLGATVSQIDLLGFQRLAAGASVAQDTFAGSQSFAAAYVRYQPRFAFSQSI